MTERAERAPDQLALPVEGGETPRRRPTSSSRRSRRRGTARRVRARTVPTLRRDAGIRDALVGTALVRSPELVARLHLFVYLRQEALSEAVELRLAYLIGADLHQRVVPALGAGRDRHLAERARVGAPPRRLVRRGKARAEEGLGLRQRVVGTEGGPMEIPHRLPSHAGLKRRSVRLFRTTLRLDHAIAALASNGESSTWSHGYSTPAATGMPITL